MIVNGPIGPFLIWRLNGGPDPWLILIPENLDACRSQSGDEGVALSDAQFVANVPKMGPHPVTAYAQAISNFLVRCILAEPSAQFQLTRCQLKRQNPRSIAIPRSLRCFHAQWHQTPERPPSYRVFERIVWAICLLVGGVPRSFQPPHPP